MSLINKIKSKCLNSKFNTYRLKFKSNFSSNSQIFRDNLQERKPKIPEYLHEIDIVTNGTASYKFPQVASLELVFARNVKKHLRAYLFWKKYAPAISFHNQQLQFIVHRVNAKSEDVEKLPCNLIINWNEKPKPTVLDIRNTHESKILEALVKLTNAVKVNKSDTIRAEYNDEKGFWNLVFPKSI